MPGFLGGGTSSGGVGGEITFAKEFIDPVTKFRVSQPENLIDTDFEYGLQPTKWETVELINNTPSFFSKSGDTTIDGIISVTTNAGTREITVKTALEHGLAVGIPIQVTGTKSITADGSYIINSIPDANTFTYLCKDNQDDTAAIEDLYTSIITGEFFQGSQIRISDADGIVTDGASLSQLTVKTESTHGFGVKTPFYFLNLNSTIAQEFPAANNTSKSFDASNSATAQTFDGSNTLSSITIDLSNSAVIGGATSTITSTDPANDTITVSHGAENFSGLKLGAPLYYDVLAASGFFAANPRGVVFLKSTDGLGTVVSAFKVSEVPDGPAIDILGNMSGTFQSANQARTFAGNNVNPLTQTSVTLVQDAAKAFDGANDQGGQGTVIANGFSGSNVTIESATVLDWYFGTMVFYSTTGTPATGLTNNTTYFVDFFTRQGSTNFYSMTLKPLPNGTVISGLSGGSGTQTFKQIGLSLDKDIIHVKDHGFQQYDMIQYQYPTGGHFGTDQVKDYYYVQTRYDQHNFAVIHTAGELLPTFQSYTGIDAQTAPITPTTATAVGFQGTLTYAVTQGPLPTGLTLNTSTGVISGTPTEVIPSPGREVIITVTDAGGNQASQTILFQFNQPPQLYAFTSATFTPGGASGYDGPNINQARNGVGNPSWASTYMNMVYNGLIEWTVPQSGTYRITAQGAGGNYDNYWGYFGASGAIMRGDFQLTQGEKLTLAIGQRGLSGQGTQGYGHSTSGGNGATFVVRGTKYQNSQNSDILLVAGAGGPPGVYIYCNNNNYPTSANTGTAGRWNSARGGNSADNGNGAGTWSTGSGGAGFFGGGSGGTGNWFASPFATTNAPLRGAWMQTDWGNRGHHGGFGGGGGAGLASGGAGGYSGGGGGEWCSYLAGGGGGSYNSGSNQSNTTGGGNTDGYITIQKL